MHLARAGTATLKKYLRSRLDELRKKNEDLSARHKKIEPMNPETQMLYYSSWIWSALHILLTIPEYQRIENICERLHLSREVVFQSLLKLEELGFIRREAERWVVTEKDIHLPKKSPLTSVNHSNWRERAVLDSRSFEQGQLHYTAVHSMSLSDFESIKAQLLRSIDEIRKTVRESPEEELVCMTLDFFKV